MRSEHKALGVLLLLLTVVISYRLTQNRQTTGPPLTNNVLNVPALCELCNREPPIGSLDVPLDARFGNFVTSGSFRIARPQRLGISHVCYVCRHCAARLLRQEAERLETSSPRN